MNGLSKDSKEMKNLFGPEYAPLDDDAFTPKYKAANFVV